jgi:hypothetical protein
MQTSEKIGAIAAAIAKAQAEMPKLLADSDNPYYKSKYIALADLIKEVRPVLAKFGLAIIQGVSGDGEKAVIITTRIIHESGEWIEEAFTMPVVAKGSKEATPQDYGAAVTYARRYSLAGILGVASEEDDDANSISVQKPIDRAAPAKADPVKHDDLKPLKDKLVELMKDPVVKPEEREGQKKAWAGKWNPLTSEELEKAILAWEKVISERKSAVAQADIF